MGPVWPCRTHKILFCSLQKAVGESDNEHVMVLRRGMPAAERGRRDMREVVVEEFPAHVGHEVVDGRQSALRPAANLTTSVFPVDEQFIVLRVAGHYIGYRR